MQKALFIAKTLRKSGIIQKGWLTPVNFHLTKKLNGISFKIPIIRNIGWNNIFENEPWMMQLFKRLLYSKQGLFIDIGANIGQTMLKAKSVNPGLTYYCYEANPVCLYYLQELIRANKLKSSYLIPVGLSEKSGIASLNFFSKNPDDATASVLEKLRANSIIEKKELVYLTPLDGFIDSFTENISFIKIDVEGAELEVIKGAISTIRKHLPVIIIEVLPAYCSENVWRIERQHELAKILKSIGYKILRIIKDEKNTLNSFMNIENFGIDSDINNRDYLLLPERMKFDME